MKQQRSGDVLLHSEGTETTKVCHRYNPIFEPQRGFQRQSVAVLVFTQKGEWVSTQRKNAVSQSDVLFLCYERGRQTHCLREIFLVLFLGKKFHYSVMAVLRRNPVPVKAPNQVVTLIRINLDSYWQTVMINQRFHHIKHIFFAINLGRWLGWLKGLYSNIQKKRKTFFSEF